MNFVFTIILIFLSSCSVFRSKLDAPDQNQEVNKPIMSRGLMSSNETFTETNIQKILNSRIAIPKKISLSIVRIPELSEKLGFQIINEKLEKEFYTESVWGERVYKLISMPMTMISQPANLTSIRNASVLLRSDMALIINPISYGDWTYDWFTKKSKSTTTIEVLLIDIRTGTVPFTTIITESAYVADNDEFSNYELVQKTKNQSEEKALLQIPKLIQAALKTL